MILEDARIVAARLNRAKESQAEIDEAQLLAGLFGDLNRHLNKIQAVAEKIRVLRSEGAIVTVVAEAKKARENVTNVAERFSERPVSSTLKQGRRWSSLNESLTAAFVSLQASIESDWKGFVSTSFFGGAPPESLKKSLTKTPQNEKIFLRYEKVFREFSSLRVGAPSNSDVLKRLKVLSEELASIKFQTDVPEPVRVFLDAIGSMQGAHIDLLTHEVRDWLKLNQLSNQYVIRSKVG